MKKFINIATALSLAAAMASCSMTENTPARHDLQDKQRLHDIRNSLPETIRIFDPGEFFPTDTKSDLGLPVDIQSDALDYDNASALSNSLYDYVQIGIKDIPHSPKSERLLLDRSLHRHHHPASGLHDTGTARQPGLPL